MSKRHKPTKAAREQTRAATEDDYKKLAKIAVEMIALKRRDVVLRFPYFVQLADDFPKGILIEKTAEHNLYRVKVFRLADWLYKHNHLAKDAKDIVKSMRTVVNMWNEATRLLDNNPEKEYSEQLESEEPVVLPIDSIFVGQIKEAE